MLVFIKFLNRKENRPELHYCVLLQGVLEYYEISVETFDERFILPSHKSSIIVCSFSLGTESLPSRISAKLAQTQKETRKAHRQKVRRSYSALVCLRDRRRRERERGHSRLADRRY